MKLKTKFQDEDFGLGEVVEGVIVECLGKHEEELRVIATAAKGGQHTFCYSSIKKFMDDWEDVPEEPKHWFIATDGRVLECNEDVCWSGEKEIGDYFETKEEAERAVKKIKAWKRLQNKGFRSYSSSICGDDFIAHFKLTNHVDYNQSIDDFDCIFDFGGEE